jgi:hypothetical protein
MLSRVFEVLRIRGEMLLKSYHRQSRQSIKSYTINGHEYGSREAGLGVEFYPVRVVIIRHDH